MPSLRAAARDRSRHRPVFGCGPRSLMRTVTVRLPSETRTLVPIGSVQWAAVSPSGRNTSPEAVWRASFSPPPYHEAEHALPASAGTGRHSATASAALLSFVGVFTSPFDFRTWINILRPGKFLVGGLQWRIRIRVLGPTAIRHCFARCKPERLKHLPILVPASSPSAALLAPK